MKGRNNYNFKELLDLCRTKKNKKLYHAHYKIFKKELTFNRSTIITILFFIVPIVPLITLMFIWAENWYSSLTALSFILISTLAGFRVAKSDIKDMVKSPLNEILKFNLSLIPGGTALLLILIYLNGIPSYFLMVLWQIIFWLLYLCTCTALSLSLGMFLGYYRIYAEGIVHLFGLIVFSEIETKNEDKINNLQAKKILIDKFITLLEGLNNWCNGDYHVIIDNLDQIKKCGIKCIIENQQVFKKNYKDWFNEEISNYLRKNYKTQEIFPKLTQSFSNTFKVDFSYNRQSLSQKLIKILGFTNYYRLVISILSFILAIIIIPLLINVFFI